MTTRLGDDLRQLDWNVYARLERLFVKLFVEEEDVTVTLLVDASASMNTGTPAKLLFAKRAAAALGYIGLASEDRVRGHASRRSIGSASGGPPRLRTRVPVARGPLGHRGRPTVRRTWSPRRVMPAAQLHGRGVVILLSDLLDPGARSRHPRARGHRVGTDRAPRPVA